MKGWKLELILGICMVLSVTPGYWLVPWPKGFDDFQSGCQTTFEHPYCSPPTPLQQFSLLWIAIGFFGGAGLVYDSIGRASKFDRPTE